MRIECDFSELLAPRSFYFRPELVENPNVIPSATGVYAWYVRTTSLPASEATKHYCGDWSLVNIGKSRVGKTMGLRRRIQAHCTRDAGHSGSFRLLLGKMLECPLSLRLLHQRHPELLVKQHSRHRDLWPEGETRLDTWLDANAAITWIISDSESAIERDLIRRYSPVCNSEGSALWDVLMKQATAFGVSRHTLRWGTKLDDAPKTALEELP